MPRCFFNSAPKLLVPALLLAFPSSAFVQKYAALPGLAAYLAFVFVAVFLASRIQVALTPFIDRHFPVLASLSMAGLMAAFLLLHPFEDRRGPGRSSDRDEGLELAVNRISEGQTPYYPQNEIAGPLSVLPGAILLSAPFVAIGSVGLQNAFWLGLFLLASAWHFRDRAFAWVLLVIPLALSPAAQYEYVSGGDLIANGIYAALFLLAGTYYWTKQDLPRLPALAAALLLGVGFASRANFILLLPLFSAFVWRKSGPRRSVTASLLVLATYAAITVPFYLNDPAGFTPLMSRGKLANHLLPWADKAAVGITVLTSVSLSLLMLLQPKQPTSSGFFRHCTIVTLIPMLCAVVLASVSNGSPDFRFMHDRFGLMYVFFMLLGWGLRLRDVPTMHALEQRPS